MSLSPDALRPRTCQPATGWSWLKAGAAEGVLVGRPMRYTESEKQELREVLLERTQAYAFPIVADMDFGHTSPQMTLPVGVRARIDSSQRVFEIVEHAVT